MVNIGTQSVYEWLVSDQDIDLLRLCPEIVVGKYIAITSIDSGALVLNENEKAEGWASRGNIAYSRKLSISRVCLVMGTTNGTFSTILLLT